MKNYANKLASKLRTFSALFLVAMRIDFETGINFFLRYLWIVFLCTTYRFVFNASLLGKEIPLGSYKMGFPLFLISGMVLIRIVLTSLKLFDDTLALFRKFGLIEWIKISPTGWWEIMLANAAWKGLTLLSEMATLIVSAHYLIGTPAQVFFQTRVMIPTFLMALAYTGLGMTISGLILLLRRGAFLFPLIHQISLVFGGVFFPTSLLPRELNALTSLIPLTSALNSVRICLVGAPRHAEMASLIPLGLSTLFCWLTGYTLLRFALQWTQKNGTL